MQSIFTAQQLSAGYYDNHCFNTGWMTLCFMSVCVLEAVCFVLSRELVCSASQMQEFLVGMETPESQAILQYSILFLGLHADELQERKIILY